MVSMSDINPVAGADPQAILAAKKEALEAELRAVEQQLKTDAAANGTAAAAEASAMESESKPDGAVAVAETPKEATGKTPVEPAAEESTSPAATPATPATATAPATAPAAAPATPAAAPTTAKEETSTEKKRSRRQQRQTSIAVVSEDYELHTLASGTKVPMPATQPQRGRKTNPDADQLMKSTYTRQLQSVLKTIKAHQWAWPFLGPVDPVRDNVPDYYTIVKRPMDMGVIQSRLQNKYYEEPQQFVTDLDLMISNCLLYNPPTSDVAHMARTIQTVYRETTDALVTAWDEELSGIAEERKMRQYQEKLEREQREQILKEERQQKERQKAEQKARKQREKAERERERQQERDRAAAESRRKSSSKKSMDAELERLSKKPMTFDEMRLLSYKINKLPRDKQVGVVKIIKKSYLAQQRLPDGQDEVEVEIDQLEPATLRELERYVNKALYGNPYGPGGPPDSASSSSSSRKRSNSSASSSSARKTSKKPRKTAPQQKAAAAPSPKAAPQVPAAIPEVSSSAHIHDDDASSDEESSSKAFDLTSGSAQKKKPAEPAPVDDFVYGAPRSQHRRRETSTSKLSNALTEVLNSLSGDMNVAGPFLIPVDKKMFPDYPRLVKKPMDLSTMRKKVEDFVYLSVQDFVTDMELIAENCHTYCESRFPLLPPVADKLVERGKELISKLPDDLNESVDATPEAGAEAASAAPAAAGVEATSAAATADSTTTTAPAADAPSAAATTTPAAAEAEATTAPASNIVDTDAGESAPQHPIPTTTPIATATATATAESMQVEQTAPAEMGQP